MVLAVLLTAGAWAGDRVSLALGMAGIAGPPASAGAAGAGYLGVRAAGPLYVDVGVRQGLLAGPTRVFTGVHAAARWQLGEHLFLRGGFVHQHETDWAAFTDDVVMVTVGASEHIRHRSGLDAGVGAGWAVPSMPFARVSLSGSAAAFPDRGGPHVYGVVETLVSFAL